MIATAALDTITRNTEQRNASERWQRSMPESQNRGAGEAGVEALPAEFTPDERKILNSAEGYKASALQLMKWLENAERTNAYDRRFELTRTIHRSDSSWGFFSRVPIGAKTIPVMGSAEEIFYDQPRTPSDQQRAGALWMRDQIREFVFHYFLRVSSFRRPEVYVEPPAQPQRLLSWCPQPRALREGLGYSQLFYKRSGRPGIGRFSTDDQFAITDLREIGPVFDWIICKVRIFDFAFNLRPLGPDGPGISIDLNEDSYLIISPEFIIQRENPAPGVLGEYGFGYAFVHNPQDSLLAYGPGQFDAAFKTFSFRVLETGEIQVRMAFVANRPTGVARIRIDPARWGFDLADLVSWGLTSRILAPVKAALANTAQSFDPVYAYIDLMNAFTLGYAGREWCISREQLDKEFLVQHVYQHYQTVIGSLLTWRQIPNWLDAPRLPRWVVTGRSS